MGVPVAEPRTYGETLRKLRSEAGLTMGDLARKLGISVTFLSEVERDNHPPFRRDVTYFVAHTIGCDPEPLLGNLPPGPEPDWVFFSIDQRRVTAPPDKVPPGWLMKMVPNTGPGGVTEFMLALIPVPLLMPVKGPDNPTIEIKTQEELIETFGSGPLQPVALSLLTSGRDPFEPPPSIINRVAVEQIRKKVTRTREPRMIPEAECSVDVKTGELRVESVKQVPTSVTRTSPFESSKSTRTRKSTNPYGEQT